MLLFVPVLARADWADDVQQINQLSQQGKYHEAQLAASESLARGPGGFLFSGTGTLIIRHQRGSIRLILGDTAGAIEDADVIIGENSDLMTPDAGYALRGLAKAAKGDAAGSMADFQAAENAIMTGSASMFSASKAFRKNFVIESRAIAHFTLGNLGEAEADLEQLAAADFETSLKQLVDLVETKKRSWAKTSEAIRYLRSGDINSAREAAQQSLQILMDGKETKAATSLSTAKMVLNYVDSKEKARISIVEDELLSQAQRQLSSGNRVGAFEIYARAYSELSATTAQEKAFQGLALLYPTLPAKPPLPETARRFLVQARAFVEDKEYARAVGLYDKAISLAPWWGASHYDRALLLGQLGRYTEATESMQRHLQLLPSAESARAGQDRIYEWEAKIDARRGNNSRRQAEY